MKTGFGLGFLTGVAQKQRQQQQEQGIWWQRTAAAVGGPAAGGRPVTKGGRPSGNAAAAMVARQWSVVCSFLMLARLQRDTRHRAEQQVAEQWAEGKITINSMSRETLLMCNMARVAVPTLAAQRLPAGCTQHRTDRVVEQARQAERVAPSACARWRTPLPSEGRGEA